MRSPDRISDVLATVEALWRIFSDWRLGQLICNVASWTDERPEKVWDIEDDELAAAIQSRLEQFAAVARG